MKALKIFVTSTATLAGALSGQSAIAQNAANRSVELEEITITAEKRESTLQQTAISIVALDGADIDREGRNDIRDLLNNVAGISFSNAAFGATNINLRGIEGSTAAAGKTDPGVSMNFDGTAASPLLGDAGMSVFYDINRVEVLRGPQGTLYGRNAEAGAINILSNNPGKEFDAAGTLELGNYNLRRYTGMVNVPMGNSWALRAAYNNVKRDGFYTSGANGQDTRSARVKLSFNNGGSVSALLGTEINLAGGLLPTGGMGAGTPAWGLGEYSGDAWDDVTKNGLTGGIPGSTQDNKQYKIWSEVNWSTGIGDLTVLPSYTRSDNNMILKTGTATPYVYNSFAGQTEGSQKAIETRFAAPADAKLKWVVGLFYSSDEVFAYSAQFTRRTWQENTSKAMFGQLTYPLADTWSLTAGLRQTTDNKWFRGNRSAGALRETTGEFSWKRTDWKLGVEKQVSTDSMVYFTAATGYRPGGVDTTATLTVTTPSGAVIPNTALSTKPEYLTTFELGTKNELFNRRLRLNGNVYYYDYKDRQYTYFITTANPANPCPNGARPDSFPPDVVCNVMLNAAAVRTIGAELESLWLITENDRLGLSASYLDAQVSENQTVELSKPPTATAPPGSPLNAVGNFEYNVKGKATPRSPKNQMNAWYQHSVDLGGGSLSFRGDVRHTGESYISGFNYLNPAITTSGFREGERYIIEANTRYDASMNFASSNDRWSLNFYVKNITDEAVKSSTDGSTTQVEAPRTAGVVFSVRM